MSMSAGRIRISSAALFSILIGLPSGCSSQPDIHRDPGVRRFEGEGIVVQLPREWEAAADVVSLAEPVGEHALGLLNYLGEVARNDQYLRLIGYEGTRTVLVLASPLLLDQDDVESVANDFVDHQESNGWEFVSREAVSIDGNEAVAVTLDHPSTHARELDVLWIEGDQGWVSAWTTSQDDYDAAKPIFEAALSTVRTESRSHLS